MVNVVKPMGVGPPGHPIDGGFPTGFLSLEKMWGFSDPRIDGKVPTILKTVALIWFSANAIGNGI